MANPSSCTRIRPQALGAALLAKILEVAIAWPTPVRLIRHGHLGAASSRKKEANQLSQPSSLRRRLFGGRFHLADAHDTGDFLGQLLHKVGREANLRRPRSKTRVRGVVSRA